MENEITVDTFKAAVRLPDGPERVADLVVALIRERDDLKSLLQSADAYVRDLKIQIDALRKVNAEELTRAEELSDQLLEDEGVIARKSTLINRLQEERDQAKKEGQVLKGLVDRQRLSIQAQAQDVNDLRDQLVGLKEENEKLRAFLIQAKVDGFKEWTID